MSKIVCIYSEKDYAVDFLSPLCNYICDELSAIRVSYDKDSDDDTITEIYDAVTDANIVFFLGHGRSDALYADLIDDCVLFDKENVNQLKGKRLFLLACNSADFIKKYGLESHIEHEKIEKQNYIYHLAGLINWVLFLPFAFWLF